jgi:hypothetical protein
MFKFEGLPKYVKQTLREKAVNVQPVGRQLGSDRVCLTWFLSITLASR